MPRVERRRVQGRPVIVTGRVECQDRRGEIRLREGDPNGLGKQLQGGCRSFDERGGDIARVFVSGAGAGGFLRM